MHLTNFKQSTSPATLIVGIILISILMSGCQHLNFFPDLKEDLTFRDEDIRQKKTQPQMENMETHEFQLADGQTVVGTIAAVNTHKNDMHKEL